MNKLFVDFEMQPIKRTFIQKRKVVRNEVIEFGAVMLDENDKEISSTQSSIQKTTVKKKSISTHWGRCLI